MRCVAWVQLLAEVANIALDLNKLPTYKFLNLTIKCLTKDKKSPSISPLHFWFGGRKEYLRLSSKVRRVNINILHFVYLQDVIGQCGPRTGTNKI
jgi:hypothetical protein